MFDPKTSSIAYVNAGHNPPRIIRKNGEVVELWVGGTVLGFMTDIAFEEETVVLDSGDMLVAFTDGVSEAMNDRDEEFGEYRIIEIAQRIHGEAPGTVLEVIEKEVATFRGERPLGDDFTLLVVKTDGRSANDGDKILLDVGQRAQ